MTYNFDPDRWFDNQKAALEARRRRGELSAEAYESELAEIERRFDEMLERLDGTYEIPGAT